MKAISNKEFQLLLSVLSELLLEENHELRDSMQRIEKLLKHAVELLNESVFSASTTLQSQQTTLESVVKPENEHELRTPGEHLLISLRKALGITVQLNNILTKTTRSLQVEDIVSQIVSHVTHRTLAIDEALVQLHKISQDEELLKQEVFMKTVNHIKLLHSHTLNNPIKQSSLDEGEIEMF